MLVKSITIRKMPSEIWKALKVEAVKQGMTLQDLVIEILNDWLYSKK